MNIIAEFHNKFILTLSIVQDIENFDLLLIVEDILREITYKGINCDLAFNSNHTCEMRVSSLSCAFDNNVPHSPFQDNR